MIVEWLPRAIENLVCIVVHIAQDNPPAAYALRDAIRAKADSLAIHPQIGWAGRRRGTREAVVAPNYLIVYRVQGDTALILRVLHARQQWP